SPREGNAMLEWLVLNTLTAAGLALLVLALSRVARLGPALRHALWLVVLAKLLTPPLVRWPWSLPVPVRTAAASGEEGTIREEAPTVPPEREEWLWAPQGSWHESVSPAAEAALLPSERESTASDPDGAPADASAVTWLSLLGYAAGAAWLGGGTV